MTTNVILVKRSVSQFDHHVADDYTGLDETVEGIEGTMRHATIGLAATGVMLGPPKSWYTWSPAAEQQRDGEGVRPLETIALLPGGRRRPCVP